MNINIQPIYRPAGLVLSKLACARIVLHRNTAQHNVSSHIRQLIAGNIFDENAINDKLGAQYYDFKNAMYWLELQNPGIDIQQISQYTGELTLIDNDSTPGELPEYVDDMPLYWLEPSREASLFETAYHNKSDMLNDIIRPVKHILGDDFPYWTYIRTIYGAYLP